MVRHSQSISKPQNSSHRLHVKKLEFLLNGPYNFAINEMEVVGLSGKSGIGKTQLLRAITDLIPHGGDVTLDGVDYRSFAAPIWRTRVTMIPAESFWWYDTVGDHFLKESDLDSLVSRLETVGFDKGVLDWHISRLSTGEKQRLALIRGLCNMPSVLLLDEPCSALDSYHTDLMEKHIIQYMRKSRAAVLWVSHDPEQLRRVAGRVLVMQKESLQETVFPYDNNESTFTGAAEITG